MNPLKDFAKNSIRLVKRCTKPDRKGPHQVPCALGGAVTACSFLRSSQASLIVICSGVQSSTRSLSALRWDLL